MIQEEIENKLELMEVKQFRSNELYQEKLALIKQQKQQYNQKVEEIRIQNEQNQVNKQTRVGGYMLPNYYDEDIGRKENEAKNMKEFVYIQQVEKGHKNAQEIN